MKILVTGASGFIGFHLVKRLLEDGHEVVGVDDSPRTVPNQSRLQELGIKMSSISNTKILKSTKYKKYALCFINVAHKKQLSYIMKEHNIDIDIVFHLAGKTGIRDSEDGAPYIDNNIKAFYHVLEYSKTNNIKRVIYASSSSVYNRNNKTPFTESSPSDKQASLYGFTKKSMEMMADLYARKHSLPIIGLRFFSVYGPYGRANMAPYLFTSAIENGYKQVVYGHGSPARDYTYIDDVIDGLIKCIDSKLPVSCNNHRIYNICKSQPVTLNTLIRTLELLLGKKMKIVYKGYRDDEMRITHGDNIRAKKELKFNPQVDIFTGLKKFIDWYKSVKE